MALIQVDFKSNALQRNVRMNVILPVDKDAHESWPDHTGIPYKTLYLLHGIYGDSFSWLTNSNIKRYAEAHNLAVVMPDGENGFYLDHPDYYNNYSKYIGEELVDISRRMFPLSHERDDTWIGGFSMGGYGALRNGLKYSDTFGIIVGMSNALILESLSAEKPGGAPVSSAYTSAMFGHGNVLETDVNPRLLAKNIIDSGKPLPKMYISCGKQDPLLSANNSFVEYMESINADVTYRTSTGRHDWEFWEKEIRYVMENWLPVENQEAK